MQGLDALGYAEHVDYDLVESTNPAFQNAIVRVNVFRDHRQVTPSTLILILLASLANNSSRWGTCTRALMGLLLAHAPHQPWSMCFHGCRQLSLAVLYSIILLVMRAYRLSSVLGNRLFCIRGMSNVKTWLTCCLSWQLLQTVQYILPQHHERLAQAELLVIDEAAAIPLPVVKAMLGPYLVFLCSTVNGCGPRTTLLKVMLPAIIPLASCFCSKAS